MLGGCQGCEICFSSGGRSLVGSFLSLALCHGLAEQGIILKRLWVVRSGPWGVGLVFCVFSPRQPPMCPCHG